VIAVLRVVGIGGQWIGAGPDHRVYVCVRAPNILQPLGPEQGCLFPDESPYVAEPTPAFGPVKVPAGTFFLLGDSRRLLDDSRTFGPVPLHAVVGPVVATLWPPSRFGLR
jgi:signal peptidase I